MMSLALSAVFVAALPVCQGEGGQDPGGRDPVPQVPGQQDPSRSPLEVPPLPLPDEDPFRPGHPLPEGRQGGWPLPEFQGFPNFPPDMEHFGGYPAPPDALTEPYTIPDDRVAPPAPERGNDWPSWIRAGMAGEDVEFSPTRSLLVRDAHRVWYLGADEPAWIPLAHYDPVRVLGARARVQVRMRGEFQIVFHDGARLRSLGRSHVGLTRLDEEGVGIELDVLTRLWFESRTRPARLHLPDGSVLSTPAASEELGGCSLYLQREDGRALVFNRGPAVARIEGPGGAAEIPPRHRIHVVLAPPGDVGAAAELRGESVAVERDGRTARAEGDGTVEYSGVRVRLGPGVTVTIDGLVGRPFGDDNGEEGR